MLRALKRRSLAAFRREVEPVEPQQLARFLPAWHGIGAERHGIDALLRAIEDLQGALVPASALERQVLGARVRGDDVPALLDRLCASGEVIWAGNGGLGGNDGWVTLALAADAHALLPDPLPIDLSDTAHRVLDALTDKGALFFRQIVDAVGSLDDHDVLRALWELVWAGHITNDTLQPVRAMATATRSAAKARRRPAMPVRLGPPQAAGRWSMLPARQADRTTRSVAIAKRMLQRHGILTRNAVVAERIPGGFGGIYAVLKAFEESGTCKRGYFVEGLGGAQFAHAGAVDRLRATDRTGAVVLAAADPANPYGAALPWPERAGETPSHRPARKAGATVVLVDGACAAYLEKGGRTLLTYDDDALPDAIAAIARAARAGILAGLSIEKHNGPPVQNEGSFADLLHEHGFVLTPRGMRLRG